MRSPAPDDLVVEAVSSDAVPEAVDLLWGDDLAGRQGHEGHVALGIGTLETSSTRASGREMHLLEARRGGRRVGAVLGLMRGSRAVQVLPPKLLVVDDDAVAGRLLAQLAERLSRAGVRVAYAYTPKGAPAAAWFRTSSYTQANDLLVLARPPMPMNCAVGDRRLSYRPYREADRERWASVLAKCGVRTLDYPQFDAMLDAHDLLDVYAATGDSGTELWRMVECEQQAVGCVMVSAHRRRGCCELTYMGLVPAARGRRWGLELVRQAISLCGGTHSAHLVAAVDSGNDPAIAIYSRSGFVVTDRQEVFLRAFSGQPA